MTKVFSDTEIQQQLTQAFGTFEVKPTGEKISATVPGFAAYGRQNFLLSTGGTDSSNALKNLFDQIVQSAALQDGKDHPAATTHVYNGDRREVVFNRETGFVVTAHEYSDQLGF